MAGFRADGFAYRVLNDAFGDLPEGRDRLRGVPGGSVGFDRVNPAGDEFPCLAGSLPSILEADCGIGAEPPCPFGRRRPGSAAPISCAQSRPQRGGGHRRRYAGPASPSALPVPSAAPSLVPHPVPHFKADDRTQRRTVEDVIQRKPQDSLRTSRRRRMAADNSFAPARGAISGSRPDETSRRGRRAPRIPRSGTKSPARGFTGLQTPSTLIVCALRNLAAIGDKLGGDGFGNLC